MEKFLIKYLFLEENMSVMKKIKDCFLFTPKSEENGFYLKEQNSNTEYDIRKENTETTEKDKVFSDIEQNLLYVKKRFTYPINNDIVIREITMKNGHRALIECRHKTFKRC